MLLLSFIFFLLLFLVTFYIPGRYLFRISGFSFKDKLSEELVSLCFGIATFLLIIYSLSWMHLVVLYYLFIGYSLFQEGVFFYQKKKNISFHLSFNRDIFIIFLGSVLTVSLTWASGMLTKNGMQFFGVNAIDGIVHMSLVNQFIDQFPPMTPYLAGVPFRGYHFFYDFMIANFAVLFPFFSVTDLFFRFFSLFLALFYGFSGLFFAKHFKLNTVGISIFLFLLYFAQGLQSLMPLFLHVPVGSYNTGIIQSLQHIFDPTVLFATAFVFILVPLFFSAKSKKEFVFVILLLGLLPMVKIYAAIMVYAGFGVTALFVLLEKRDIKPLMLVILSGFLSIYVYVPLNFGAGKLLLAPFLLYRHFIEGSPAFASFQWGLKYQYYASQQNIIRIIWLYALAVFWYFVPTFGLRFVLFFKLGSLKKKTFFTSENIFWIVVCAIGFLIPTFFIQSVDVFNILQFIWFSYIFLLIPTAVILSSFFSKNIIKNCLLFLCIIVLSLPDIFTLFLGYQRQPKIIAENIVVMSEIAHAKVPQRDAIIVLDDTFEAPVMAALTGRQLYYEPTSLGNPSMDSLGKNRQVILRVLTDSLQSCSLSLGAMRHILGKTNVRYLLLLQPSRCFPIDKPIAHVGQAVLYKL